MKNPLFIIEGLDVSAYAMAEELEKDVEPFFVKKVDYKAYDSEGRILTLGIVMKEKPIYFGLFKTAVELVVVQSAEVEAMHANDLRDALSKYLKYQNKENTEIYDKMSLERLVQKFIELNGFVKVGKLFAR